MIIETQNQISISEASQNFSKVIKCVDACGDAIILRNNKPAYIVSKFSEISFDENDMLELVARRILSEHKRAFEILANE